MPFKVTFKRLHNNSFQYIYIYHVEIIFMKLVFIKQAVPEMNAESPLENTSYIIFFCDSASLTYPRKARVGL